MLKAENYSHKDKRWLGWIHEQPEAAQCLFCTNAATDWCHVEHGSSRSGDFMGHPACHDHHMAIYHAPQGVVPIIKTATVQRALAYWFTFDLPTLLARYTAL